MSSFFFGIIVDLLTGASRTCLKAAEAFETPPRTPQASRCRGVALTLFMTSAGLLLAAALTFVLAPQKALNEILGWSGVACLQLCVVCGVRYAIINNAAESQHE